MQLISQSCCLQEAHCLRGDINNEINNHRKPGKAFAELECPWCFCASGTEESSGVTEDFWGEITLD